jgi:hypothetical protein
LDAKNKKIEPELVRYVCLYPELTGLQKELDNHKNNTDNAYKLTNECVIQDSIEIEGADGIKHTH